MLDKEQYAELFNEVLSTCTFPRAAELDDHRCAFCQDDSLGPKGTEKPAKLPCGHFLGMSCLMIWILKQVDDGSSKTYCPFCAKSFLQLPAVPNRDLDKWIELLATDSPGNPCEKGEEWIRKVRRAEELWNNLCSTILDYVELGISQTEIPLAARIEEYLYGRGQIAQEFLSFGSVFQFNLARSTYFDLFRTSFATLSTPIQCQYDELLTYLRDDANRSEFNIEVMDHMEWRVFDAYQSPNHLPEYRRRLEWCRWKLGQEAGIARDAR
ncbi:MAG: hypothetical protein L6R41_001370 [Letrouitia leprolyta]|nr:MAG: hypothetical protein L6R41_001370 [Letrouitia leprolyta]